MEKKWLLGSPWFERHRAKPRVCLGSFWRLYGVLPNLSKSEADKQYPLFEQSRQASHANPRRSRYRRSHGNVRPLRIQRFETQRPPSLKLDIQPQFNTPVRSSRKKRGLLSETQALRRQTRWEAKYRVIEHIQ